MEEDKLIEEKITRARKKEKIYCARIIGFFIALIALLMCGFIYFAGVKLSIAFGLVIVVLGLFKLLFPEF